jgi:hypothetical protein
VEAVAGGAEGAKEQRRERPYLFNWRPRRCAGSVPSFRGNLRLGYTAGLRCSLCSSARFYLPITTLTPCPCTSSRSTLWASSNGRSTAASG